MSAARNVTVVLWALLAIAACSDGGPPAPWANASTHQAATSAADGGTSKSSERDAGGGDDADSDAGQ